MKEKEWTEKLKAAMSLRSNGKRAEAIAFLKKTNSFTEGQPRLSGPLA
jgi:hypothetical protein